MVGSGKMKEKQLVFFWHNEKKEKSLDYYLQLQNNFFDNEDNSKGIFMKSLFLSLWYFFIVLGVYQGSLFHRLRVIISRLFNALQSVVHNSGINEGRNWKSTLKDYGSMISLEKYFLWLIY